MPAAPSKCHGVAPDAQAFSCASAENATTCMRLIQSRSSLALRISGAHRMPANPDADMPVMDSFRS